MIRSIAFSPAHITGFFKIFNDGSTGAGITLGEGMLTEVSLLDSGNTKIKINNRYSHAQVSRLVIGKYAKLAGRFGVAVNHKARIPIGYGLGMSAAGALSLSLALADCLGVVNEREARQIAHLSELECKTGLGGVIAESTGGLVLRTKAGSFDKVKKINVPDCQVICYFLGPIRTRGIITSEPWKKRINHLGQECLTKFSKKKTFENFLKLSRYFSIESRLASGPISKILGEYQDCSMAMLGKTIFSTSPILLNTPNMLVTKTSSKKARVL